METLQISEKNNDLFIKSFLVDSSVNKNQWRITEEALQSDLSDFIGKPFIVMADGHPDGELPDNIFDEIQNSHKVGEITETGIDEGSGKGFAVSRLSEDFGKTPQDKERIRNAIEQIKSGHVNFVSP